MRGYFVLAACAVCAAMGSVRGALEPAEIENAHNDYHGYGYSYIE